MAKPTHTQPQNVKNNAADIVNANIGTKGTNIAYDKNQGNRGEQLNLNRRPAK